MVKARDKMRDRVRVMLRVRVRVTLGAGLVLGLGLWPELQFMVRAIFSVGIFSGGILRWTFSVGFSPFVEKTSCHGIFSGGCYPGEFLLGFLWQSHKYDV